LIFKYFTYTNVFRASEVRSNCENDLTVEQLPGLTSVLEIVIMTNVRVGVNGFTMKSRCQSLWRDNGKNDQKQKHFASY